MADKEFLDASLALTKALYLLVEESRQGSSALRVMTSKVGELCDDLRDYSRRSDERHSESESKIRVVQSRQDDFERRLKPVEEAYKAAAKAARESGAR